MEDSQKAKLNHTGDSSTAVSPLPNARGVDSLMSRDREGAVINSYAGQHKATLRTYRREKPWAPWPARGPSLGPGPLDFRPLPPFGRQQADVHIFGKTM